MHTCKSKVCNPPSVVVIDGSPDVVAATQDLILTSENFKQYKKAFLENIQRGLGKATNEKAIIKCFPTYVQDLPDGTEEGQFLALDLGGSNFRVLLVTIAKKNVDQQSQVYTIPPEVITGTGTELFDFIAASIADFLASRKLEGAELPLGFTFSFPCWQTGLIKGILRRWTKGFTADGVVGENVVDLLADAIGRHGNLKVKICAILNDTTGTLMACAIKYPLTRIGLIVATGTNACYLEQQINAELFDEPDGGSGKVIINLESGAFGDDGALDFCKTKYDEIVDEWSPNEGQQTHEKMIAGMYLGELVRLCVERLTKDGLMFGGKGSDKLFTVETFETSFLSEIESDPVGTYDNVKRICDQLDLSYATETDYINLRYVCQCFSRRAAFLVSGELSVLIEKIAEPMIVIGVDGTLYKNHPNFHNLMMQKTRELTNPKYKFNIVLAEDGSGIGAAVIASVADRLLKSIKQE